MIHELNQFFAASGLDFCQPLTLDAVKKVSLDSTNIFSEMYFSLCSRC